MSGVVKEPTIFPRPNFVALDDAKVLRKAVGTDTNGVISTLTRRTNDQRQEILTAYKKEFGRDLRKDMKTDLSGKFGELMLSLLDNPGLYLAKILHKAMAGIGTNKDLLTETLCTQSNDLVRSINEEYLKLYGKSVEDDLRGEMNVSGDYKDFLLTLLGSGRHERAGDLDQAKKTIERLYVVGERKVGTDEQPFLYLFSRESFEQIKLVAVTYEDVYGKSLVELVKQEFSGDILKAFLVTLKFAESRLGYFAELLESALSGIGLKDEGLLVRIIVSRTELDLDGIKREYEHRFKKKIYDAVGAETTGDYRTALLGIIGNF